MIEDSAGMEPSRRALLAGLGLLPALAGFAIMPAVAQAPTVDDSSALAREALAKGTGTKLVILGTGGGPQVHVNRRMTSHVMYSDGVAYVVDCGLGVTEQIFRCGVPLAAVRNVFITHHHPDHNVEYGPLLLLSWVAGRAVPVGAYGPPPLAQMTDDYIRMQKYTTDIWSEDVGAVPFPHIDVNEQTSSGPVMKDDRVSVQCAVVQHPPVKPAFAYRFDFHDRSIVFSGDTVALPAVAQLAKGADILVHEAMDFAATERLVRSAGATPARQEQVLDHMRRDHTPAVDVGRIATEAGVKTLVLSHFTPPVGVTDDAWRAEAAQTFKGKIVVAHDLLVL